MASSLTKTPISKLLLNVKYIAKPPSHNISNFSRVKKAAVGSLCLIGTGIVGTATALQWSVSASDEDLHPPHYPWPHGPILSTLDAGSIRRGYQVYSQVCSACHSLKYLSYRNLVGVSHTEEEAKAIAAEAMVTDGPNDAGEMFQRPGKLSDRFVGPYKNEQEARAANNGALPPDLSYIILAREGEEDYIFSLLTGYQDPPAGVTLAENQHYNAYFTGQAIGMQAPIYDEIIEYEDGTPATMSQLAKDVATFLRWTSEPSHDTRKMHGFRMLCFFSIMIPMMWYHKKRIFSTIKSKKIAYKL